MSDHGDLILGLDVGGTKSAVVIGTVEGKIVWRKEILTRADRGFEPVFGDLLALIADARSDYGSNVSALSVSIGGPLDVRRGIIKSPPNLPGWIDIPLKSLLVDRTQLPVYIEHDGNAGALAEFFFGAGRGFRNIIFLTMGTGFGAGLILDGQLFRGTTDMAGEVGHIRIAETGPLSYGKAGSLEGYASGSGIPKLANALYPSLWSKSVTMKEIYGAYLNGQSEAKIVFETAGKYLGRGLAILVDMLNPERIILGGIGMRIGDALLFTAERVLREEALPEAVQACRIVPAELGESIGDLSAICAALDQGKMMKH